ncbi:hypothetical protein, partial [Pseudomonas aeruginosa]
AQAYALPVRPFAGTVQPFRRAGRAALDPETPATLATCRSDRDRRLHQLLAGQAMQAITPN